MALFWNCTVTLVIMTTLIFFYSKLQGIPYPFCTLNTTAIGQSEPAGRQSNSQEMEMHTPQLLFCHMLSQQRRTESPSEDGIRLQSQHADFTTEGYLVPIPRSNHGHWIVFYIFRKHYINISIKRGKKNKRRNKTLLGTILSEWYLLGTEQTGSCQGDGDTHHPYANPKFPISALLNSAAILQLQALGKQKRLKWNKALSCHLPVPHTPQQKHRGRGAGWELNKIKRRKILIAGPKGASLL